MGDPDVKPFLLAVLAYLVPTFALGFVWHLVLFESHYRELGIYRDDIVIPFGFLAMLIQGVLFAAIYREVFAARPTSFGARALGYGIAGAVLSWSFTTLAVSAKNVMASVPDYMAMETAYTALQWLMVAPLTVAAFGGRPAAAGA